MMTKQEMLDRLSDAATIAVDTNAVRLRRLFDLLNQTNLINDRRPPDKRLAVRIPALVHAERLFQERRARGAAYDEDIPMTELRNKGAVVEPFDEVDASRHGALLADHHATDEAWSKAKGNRSSTVDWFIATQSAGRGWLLVTADRGVEFAWCDWVVDPKTMLEVLAELAGGKP